MDVKVSALVTDHPNSVGETYIEHMCFALGFAGRMFAASLAAVAHAFLPFVFVSTGSDMVARMHTRNVRRFGGDQKPNYR
jgi:hypothetical protein